MKFDSLRFEIICFGLIVPVRYNRFVSECKTERNKTDVFRVDREYTTETAAAQFALNPSTAFCQTQKARTKLGKAEFNPMFHFYKRCERFSS